MSNIIADINAPPFIVSPVNVSEPQIDRQRSVGVTPDVAYFCDTTGSLNTNLTWYYNGALIRQDSGVIVLENGTLIIPTPQISHSGIYQCIATNSYGPEDSRAWILEVRGDGRLLTGSIDSFREEGMQQQYRGVRS